jgi:type I restriction enzyme S subunit
VNGIPLVNPAHITETGILTDDNKSVSLDVADRLSSYVMQEGDIVIGRRGEMGRCALVTEKEDGFLCGTGSFFIKSSSRCHGEYLVQFLRSASCKARLESIAGGAVMPNLSNKDLSSFTLNLPSYQRQKELATEIVVVEKRTRNVADVYKNKLSSLDELKKSLLQKAFSGELTKSKGIAA